MAMDFIGLSVGMGYTEETVIGGGALKGKNCVVSNIEEVADGVNVTFQSILDDGTVKTDTVFIPKGTQGEDGVDGKSAYEIWLEAGNTGTEQDFLISLVGENGKSAYQYAQDGGYIGTETEFTTNIARSGVISKELEVERARIDNLTTLQDGSTTGDAELIDGRIDYTGKTWSNIGSHIRSVSTELKNDLIKNAETNIDIPVYSVIENATIVEDKARINPFTSVVRNVYTANVTGLETITVSQGDVYAFYVNEPTMYMTSYNEIRYEEPLDNTVVSVPDGVGYIAVRSENEVTFTSPTPLQKEVMDIKEITDALRQFTKKPYVENRIYFTVSVNQNSYDRTDDTTSLFENVGCVLQLPSNYDNGGKAVPLVMACHGTGGYVTSNEANQLASWDYFYNNGFAVFDVNGSVENTTNSMTKGMNMGSPRTVQAYYKAYEYIITNYNILPTIFVTGRSMGGLPALNFARSFPQVVRAIGLCYPVTDMYNQAWENPWLENVRRTMASEFFFDDITGETYEEDKIAGYNPILNGLTVDTKKYVFMNSPIKIWHGNADTTVDYNGSVEYVEAVKNAGGVATIKILDGVGHEMASGDSVYNLECVQWFNRFIN